MSCSRIGIVLAVGSVWVGTASSAFAHPSSGIAVTDKGEVLFVYKGMWKIDADGKLTQIHRETGGHWMALDTDGFFSSAKNNRLFERLTPERAKPVILYASGGAPLVVNRDGNLYYGGGYPDGDDTGPGGHTLARIAPDGTKSLFSPALKSLLAETNEAVTGLANGPGGEMFVACPNAIVKVRTDGTASKYLHPVVVKDCDDDLAKDSRTRFFHSPYLRGLVVLDDGTIYAAVTGCRCVIKITPDRKVETVLKSERPWTPTGVAFRGKDLFVLEFTHPEWPQNWLPRVRKLNPDGKVTTLASFADERDP